MVKNKISEKKMFMMLSTELFAMTSLILPAVLVGFAGKNGLPVLLASSGFLILVAVWYLRCFEKRKNSPDQLVEEQKRGIGKTLKAIYIVRFFIHGLFLAVIFVNLIQEVLLPDASIFWILAPFLLLAYMMEGKQLRVRGRIIEVLFPYIFVPLLIVLLLALFQIDFSSLPEQLWGKGVQNMKDSMLYGTYGILLFYQPIEFILFLLPALEKGKSMTQQKRKRESYVTGAACIYVILINVIMYVAAIGLFGTIRTGEKLWSALYIMQSVRLPGKFVQRLDILFLVFWIFSVFALFSAYLYYGSRFIVSEPVETNPGQGSLEDRRNGHEDRKKTKWYTALWLLGILFLTLVIKKPKEMFELFVPYKMWIDFPLSVLIPAFLYRKRECKRKKKGLTAAFLVMMCSMLLSGCQDRADIEDKNYVMTLAVEQGEKKQYRIFYEIADLSGDSKNGGGRKGRIFTYEADSLKEAEEINKFRTDKKLDYGHLKTVLFSKKLMEEETLRTPLIKELEAKDSIAGTTLVFFAQQDMKTVMETGGKLASSFGEYMDQMMTKQRMKTGKEDTLAKLLRDESEKKGSRKIWLIQTAGEQLELKRDTLEKQPGDISGIAQSVIRFHIRAESDSELDQARKNAVKDRILPKLQELFAESDSKESCLLLMRDSTELIESWVREACAQEQYFCESSVYVCRESFPLKEYGNIILPSGTYDALRIDLGKAEGANWWCMMYPSLCYTEGVIEKVSDEGTKELKENLEEEEYESLFAKRKENKYHIKWKVAEWWKSLWED